MPVVNLPGELHGEEENVTGMIINPKGSGVAIYWASDRSVRADVYVGLVLDGYKLYQNISAVNPNIKMQFVHKPTVSCNSGDVHFDPDENELISIKVSRTYWCIIIHETDSLKMKRTLVTMIEASLRVSLHCCSHWNITL